MVPEAVTVLNLNSLLLHMGSRFLSLASTGAAGCLVFFLQGYFNTGEAELSSST